MNWKMFLSVFIAHGQGYDMEDAMVINRGSLQRGFAYGTVYKSEFVDLKEIVERSTSVIDFICSAL